ncbi:MAG: bifunctional serine/threonine-protein kinase/formylglycine-generating enzyme family protein [Pirellulaceae bacterium]
MSQHEDLPLAEFQQIDAACDEFESAWKGGAPFSIEQRIASLSDPLRSSMLRALLEVEVELRLADGQLPTADEYLARFPSDPSLVRQALVAAAPSRTPEQDTFAVTRNPADVTRPFGAAAPVAPPSVIGPYHIERRLGEGGFGVVLLARDERLDRSVALKIPHESSLELQRRFQREARAIARLRHPNICPLYDYGEFEGRNYLVMAYINGESLSDILRHRGAWPPEEAVALTLKIAAALVEAHEHGVIHRDLKPPNVMIDQRGEPIVMDFGLARDVQEDAADLTVKGDILGTPAYMPPEQARGDIEAIGPWSDVYSLGAILYELLSGRRPFTGKVGAVIAKIFTEEPPSLTTIGDDTGLGRIDDALDAICRRAMAKNVADRYPTMAAFRDALLAHQTGQSLPRRPLAGSPSRDDSGSIVTTYQKAPTERRSRAKLVVAFFGAAVAVLLGVALLPGLLGMLSRDEPPTKDRVADLETSPTGASDAPPSEIAAQDSAAAADESWVDALSSIDPATHTIFGTWRHTPDGLTVDPARIARILVPTRPSGGYDLNVEFTRRSGVEAVILVLPVGRGSVSLILGGWGSTVGGLEYVADRGVDANPTTRRWTPQNGRRYSVLVRVRLDGDRASIGVDVDDSPFTQWEGPIDQLKCAFPELVWDGRCIGLSAYDASATFHQVRLRPVGQGANLQRVAGPMVDWSGTPGPGALGVEPRQATQLQQAWAKHAGVPVEMTDDQTITLALIPPGEFAMSKDYEVTISRPYYLSTTEVTVSQFRRFVADTGYETKAELNSEGGSIFYDQVGAASHPSLDWKSPGFPSGDDHPVAQLSWLDAEAFCRWMTEQEGVRYRLPTEAEWEWASRSGSSAAYYFGDDVSLLGEHAWYRDNTDRVSPQPVGRLKPNAWGLYDMYGNQLEFVADWHDVYPSGRYLDPQGYDFGEYRLLRGGAMIHSAEYCTSHGKRPHYAERGAPDWSTHMLGIRVLREIPPAVGAN